MGRCGVADFKDKMGEYWLWWFGHVMRRSAEDLMGHLGVESRISGVEIDPS